MHSCYPPAVDTPLYYMINGVAFEGQFIEISFATAPSTVAPRNILIRLVNAGLRMHVPAIVQFADGHVRRLFRSLRKTAASLFLVSESVA
jgi:hypothetical protein